MNLPARDQYLKMTDDELSACCTLDFYKGSGPGGQHRNKTSTGVRLIFQPLACQVCDDAERSQHRNRHAALLKLRLLIARTCRAPAPESPAPYRHLQRDNPEYPLELARLLDAIAAAALDHKAAAQTLGLSHGALLKELGRENDVWLDFAAARHAAGLPALSRPR